MSIFMAGVVVVVKLMQECVCVSRYVLHQTEG